MAKADVIISKPGGLSVFEAIYAEKPLFLFPPKLEQEKRNGQFMAESGMLGIARGERRYGGDYWSGVGR